MRLFPGTFSFNRLLFFLTISALLSCSSNVAFLDQNGAFFDPRSAVKSAFVRPTREELAREKEHLTDVDRARIVKDLELRDPGLTLYRDPSVRGIVIDYFCNLTENEDVALSIIYHSDRENVPLLLSFSLAWVESRYSPHAVNVNAGSVDRGIFQLNSRSFPNLTAGDFFDVDTNIDYGVRHLRYCLDFSDDEATALAIYNAGLSSVMSRRIPASTRAYVSRILQFQKVLMADFRSQIEKSIQSADTPQA